MTTEQDKKILLKLFLQGTSSDFRDLARAFYEAGRQDGKEEGYFNGLTNEGGTGYPPEVKGFDLTFNDLIDNYVEKSRESIQ